MRISKEHESQVDSFIEKFLDFSKSKQVNKHYKENTKYAPGSGYIELKTGLLIPENTESVLVLDKEFEAFMYELVTNFFKLMYENLENPLFGFAERTLYEFTILWLFITTHGDIPQTHKDRIRTLLFAGYYKYFENENGELVRYLKQRKQLLDESDLIYLEGTYSAKQYFNRLWKKAKNIRDELGSTKYEPLLTKYSDYTSVNSHQHMRVHANPLALNESIRNKDARVRRKILLSMFAAQVCEYSSSYDKNAKKLLEEYESLRESLNITPG